MSAVLQSGQRRIRRMLISDVPAVHAIELIAYPYPWSRQVFADCLAAGYSGCVSEVDGRLAGYGLLSAAAGEGHILNLCVSPHYQRQGHGAALLRRLLDLGRWYRLERVLLEVRQSNHAAIELYRRHHFDLIGTRPDYYPHAQGREAALVMARELLNRAS